MTKMGSTPTATVASFKAQFFRDFTYGDGPTTVMDRDIQNGLNAAASMFNPGLFDTTLLGAAPNQTSESLRSYLNCAAHFMVQAIQAVGGLSIKMGAGSPGLMSQGEGTITNKSGGGLNASYSWPDIDKSPTLFQFTKTAYGLAYLQVLMPKLVGNVGTAAGETADSSDFAGPF